MPEPRTHPERAAPLSDRRRRRAPAAPDGPPDPVYLQQLADAFAIEHGDTPAVTWARQADLLADSRRPDYGRTHHTRAERDAA